MSDSKFQNPSNFNPAFSPFDTFEMPTSGFVLDLPPLASSADAQNDDQLAASEPVSCYSDASEDGAEDAVSEPVTSQPSEACSAAVSVSDSATEADQVSAEAEPLAKNSVEISASADNVAPEPVKQQAAELPSAETSPDDKAVPPEAIAPEAIAPVSGDVPDRGTQVPVEERCDIVASFDDDDVDDVMVPPPVNPAALAAVTKSSDVAVGEPAQPQHAPETTQQTLAEAPSVEDASSPSSDNSFAQQQNVCETAIADALLTESSDVAVEESVREPALIQEAAAEQPAVEEAEIEQPAVEEAQEAEIEQPAVMDEAAVIAEPAAEPVVVEPAAAAPVVAEQSVAESIQDFAESFVAMPQVSVASNVFQDEPCATSNFQPQPQPPVPSQTPEPAQAQATTEKQSPAPVREPKPVIVKASPPVAVKLPTPVNTAAPVKAPVAVNPAVQANAEEPVPSESAEPMFRDLDLSEGVQQAIQQAGYERPTPIQAQIIPHILEGRDVLAQSQTGTGKTAAFALPILSRLDFQQRKPQVLVLAPTRELAIQVANSFTTYGAKLPGFSVAAIYGGHDYEAQFRQLKRGVQVVVGTPGRVIDHINRGTLDLSELRCLALDEADEMLNMGFLEDVQLVLDHTPEDRQVALFSATLPAPIRNIAQQYLKDPVRITIKQKTMTAESIRQRALFVPPRDKIDVLTRFLEAEESDGVIVFTKTKDATVTVAEQLCQQGFSAIALNGDMAQKVRERTIHQLKNGQLDILVATDVAARGLDVTRVSHVFNFDVPNDSESYVHRIGRTGRAGRKGEAIIFLTNSQRHKLKIIERATRQPIEVVRVPGAEEINALRISRFQQKISETIAAQDVTIYEQMIREFAEKSGQSLINIAAALAHLSQGGRPFLMTDRPVRKPQENRDRYDQPRTEGGFNRERRRPAFEDRGERFEGQRNQRSRGPENFRQLGAPEPGMDRYRIEVGRNDGVKPGNIVGAVANEGGINGDQIGPIRIHDDHSTIDLPQGMPQDVYQTLQQTVVAGRQLRLSRDHSAADRSQSRAGKRPFVPRKPAQFSRSKKRPSGAPPRGQR